MTRSSRLLFILLATYALCLKPYASQAQQVRPATSAQVYREIAQLKNLTNVLYVAAHPDDENTRLLAWLVNDQHVRTAYLSLTRGDGGQNILGSEQGDALGLIRTHELMEARKLDGAEQFFTRAVDFGFSKTSEETFKHWNEDQVTEDAVWIIRNFRPDIIICRFPPTAQAGHGHHAASAIIGAKAFAAAGDKTKYPSQLEYVKAWKPKRLLFNAFRFGSSNTTTEDMFKLKVGNYSPLLGMGYGELAGISRSIHKSQGAGTPSVAGVQQEYFKLLSGDSMSSSLFDGIDITWNRVDRTEIGEQIEAILKDYDFQRPENSLPALLALRKEIKSVKNNYWRTQKLKELDQVIIHATGIMAEMVTRQQAEAARGDSLTFTLNLIARADVPVRIKNIKWLDSDSVTNIRLKKDSLYSFGHRIILPENVQITQPYWLAADKLDDAHYDNLGYEGDMQTVGLPETPNRTNVVLTLKIGNDSFNLNVPLSYKKLDPTKGDVVEQLRILPAATVSFTSPLLVVQPDGSLTASINVHPSTRFLNSGLKVNYKHTENSVAYIPYLGLRKKIDTTVTIYFSPKKVDSISKGDFSLSPMVESAYSLYSTGKNTIQYDHLGTLQYFTPAKVKVLRPDWQSKAKRIGYIEGAGDEVDDVLRLTGLQVDMLKEADIDAAKLKQYDAILVGIRAINTEKKMATWMPTLLKYTENGGTLVMQYNTMQDMSTNKLGPYPLTLSRTRVTEEDAKVEYLLPQHKLLNYPNKITEEDWQNWVQERGLYFPEKWDDKYQALFSMNDSGEQPLKGSTLYAPYGKGHYIYTSLSFFRQLPAGNKGSVRLLMNMLSVGK